MESFFSSLFSFKREMRSLSTSARVCVRLHSRANETVGGELFVKARRVPYDRILNVDGGKDDFSHSPSPSFSIVSSLSLNGGNLSWKFSRGDENRALEKRCSFLASLGEQTWKR